MSVGKRIKARRKELGMSAETLALKLGCHSTTVYRYESGSIEKIDAEKLIPIAEALHTTPAYLMGWEDEEVQKEESKPLSPLDEKWHMLSAGVENLPDYRKQAMIGIVESAMAAFNEARNEKK